MAPAQSRRLRADAERNREQILAAARELFIQDGVSVPMEEIARRAGVGIGTLYRRFPDRESLIRGVAIRNMEWAATELDAAHAEEPDDWSAFARFLRRAAERRLGDAIPILLPSLSKQLGSDPELQHAQHVVSRAVEALRERLQHDGRMRADVTLGDIIVAAMAVPPPIHAFGPELAASLVERHVRIVLDGFRADGGQAELPAPALMVETFDALFRS